MTDIELLFNNRQADTKKLIAFGFVKNKKGYTYSTALPDGQFEIRIALGKNGKITADVIDPDTDEIYVPVKLQGATGAFVGKVKAEYTKLLTTISEECFYLDSFKSAYAKKVIAYVKREYQDELEFLWPKSSKSAILRRQDNAKWYAALINLPGHKVGLSGEENIDIIDLRIDHSTVDTVVDGKKYLPGYHMNKNHWFTIRLDGSVPIKEIYDWIDASYRLAKK